MSKRSRIHISTRKKVLFSAGCTLLVLIFCEFAVRARVWIRHGFSGGAVEGLFVQSPEFGMRIPRPGYEAKGSSTWIKINSLGFRGDEMSTSKPKDTVRIACLGGSTTFCAEASSNATTWPVRLADELARNHPAREFEVINAGVSGCDANYTLENLRKRVLPLEPDLVIVYHANNDIMKDALRLARERGIVESGIDHRPRGLFGLLVRYSLLIDLAHKNFRIAMSQQAQRRQGETDTPRQLNGIPEDMPSRFIGVYEEIYRELSDRNIPMVVAKFQTKYRRGQDRSEQIRNADVTFWNAPWLSIDDLLEAMELYNQAIVDFAKSHQIPVVVDTRFIPADDQHFADAMHLTDAGCARLAAQFVKLFEESPRIEEVLRQPNTETEDG